MATAERLANYYEILGISSSADVDEIRERIRDETRNWTKRTTARDLDKRQQAELRMRQLSEANSILLDPETRRDYDERMAHQPPQPTGPPTDSPVGSGGVEEVVARARQHLGLGEIPAALRFARQATELDPRNADAWAILAEAKAQFGQLDEAVYEYRRAIDLDPGAGSHYFGLGTVLESKQDWASAQAEYKRAEACDTEVTVFKVASASMDVRLGRYEQAEAVLQRAVETDPDQPVFQYYLAVCLNDMTVSEWTPTPSGQGAITNREVADRSELRLERALDLKFDDDQLRELIRKNLLTASHSLETRWRRPLGETFKGGLLLGVGLIIAFSIGAAILILIVVAATALWVARGVQPGWKAARPRV